MKWLCKDGYEEGERIEGLCHVAPSAYYRQPCARCCGFTTEGNARLGREFLLTDLALGARGIVYSEPPWWWSPVIRILRAHKGGRAYPADAAEIGVWAA